MRMAHCARCAGRGDLADIYLSDETRRRMHRATREGTASSPDPVNNPTHYTRFPGVEVIQLTEHLNFCRGNAVKYICRAGAKDATTEVEDLRKAAWYIAREIDRITRGDNQ